ncbi:MAG: hypothetical protein ACREQM_07200 [Candidatus Dormibacteraceae bacterium]
MMMSPPEYLGLEKEFPAESREDDRRRPTLLVVVERRDPDARSLASLVWLARSLHARAVAAALVTRDAAFDELDAAHIRIARERVARVARALERAGVPAEHRVVVGGPGEPLSGSVRDLVDALDPALTCVLAPHRSRLGILPGSRVARHLSRVGTRPVVIVAGRASDRRPDEDDLRLAS